MENTMRNFHTLLSGGTVTVNDMDVSLTGANEDVVETNKSLVDFIDAIENCANGGSTDEAGR